MTGGESEEERSLYLLSICLCVVPCATLWSLLFLETEEALPFWETKVKLPMLEMLSDLVFLSNLQVICTFHFHQKDRLGQGFHREAMHIVIGCGGVSRLTTSDACGCLLPGQRMLEHPKPKATKLMIQTL